MTPKEALKKYWGYDSFRELQEESIDSVLAGKDTLVILPTGGGKSLCFQVPALCSEKMTLVISPLIALMDDQVAAARDCGIKAAAMHSNLKEGEKRQAYFDAINGELDLLYISPERIALGDLIEQLQPHISLIAIDEAHCISHWGHDFRPEYRQLANILSPCDNVPKMALTATATPQVQNDICNELELKNPERLVGHMDRPNLLYRAIPRNNGQKQILSVIKKHGNSGGIVYAQTRKEVEKIADKLCEAGVSAAPYHAGLPAEKRLTVQDDFIRERISIVVATIAFGMGIDRSNVRFVIHANTPKSIEHYQQESGRAGRDGMPAECVLLYSYADIVKHRKLAELNGPISNERKAVLETHLKEIGRYSTAPICRHSLLLQHFGQSPKDDVKESCEACDVCLGETEQIPSEEAKIIAQKIISCVWRCNSRFGAIHISDILMGSQNEKIKRLGHDNLSTHGLLKEKGSMAIRQWIDQLVVQSFLKSQLTENGFPLLTMTQTGLDLCQGKGEAKLSKAIETIKEPKTKKSSTGKPKAKKQKIDTSGADKELFEKMRILRKLIADKIGKPPYIVFSDATLYELATSKPKSLNEFLFTKGVGDKKCEKYGPSFTSLIKEEASPEELVLTFKNRK